MRALSLLLLLLTTAASADSLRFGGLSTHIGSERNYNSFHRALIYEHDSGYTAGYFYNSYYDDAFLIGKRFTKKDRGVELGLTVGATYGYRKDGGCYKYQGMDNYSKRIVCPVVAPSIRANLPLSPEITLFGNAAVLTLGLEF